MYGCICHELNKLKEKGNGERGKSSSLPFMKPVAQGFLLLFNDISP